MAGKLTGGKRAFDLLTGLLKAGNGMLSVVSGVVASAMIAYSGYALYDSVSTSYRASSSSWDLQRYKPEIIEDHDTPVYGESLASVNPDYRGWLSLDDTNIDYPVVQGENDLYYASHDIHHNASLSGAIYLAAGNTGTFSDSYNLIYGHHMEGTMFGSLDQFVSQSYFNAHQTGILVAGERVYDLTLFAVVSTDAYENQLYTVGNRAAEVRAFLKSVLQGDESGVGVGTHVRIIREATANSADKILALSTCANADTNGRLVVFAKMTLRETIPDEPAEPSDEPTEPSVDPTDPGNPDPSPAPSETPTDTPEPVTEYTLTVRYRTKDGTRLRATDRYTYRAGDPYSVKAPVIDGYKVETAVHTGVMDEDRTVVFIYEPIAETVQYYTLTVRYVTEDGETISATERYTFEQGETYTIEPLRIAGYRTESGTRTGVMDGDHTIVIVYKALPYTVTVEFQYLSGEEVFPTYQETLNVGDAYSIPVPKLENYHTARQVVEGVMPGRNVHITVLYLPDDELENNTLSINDYETPLGVNQNNLQIGICIE